MRNSLRSALAVMVFLAATASSGFAQTTLLTETFEDTNFAARGWYDFSGTGILSSAEKYSGTKAYECRFLLNGTKCSGGDIGRHKFADSDSIYISYYIKHSTSWVGSGRNYHPHMFMFLSNLDGDYSGPAYTYLTAYIEQNAGQPVFIIQDGRNIDETKVGVNLVGVTEQRAVAGCNGDSDGYGAGGCYANGAVHWNDKWWKAGQVYFDSTPGSPYFKNNWHKVEAYFKLNSIVNGVGAKDGIIRYWYDGTLIMEYTNIVMRTGARPTMKFRQMQLIPYIGDGSPVDQVIWIDDLVVATAPPTSTTAVPRAPTNLRILD